METCVDTSKSKLHPQEAHLFSDACHLFMSSGIATKARGRIYNILLNLAKNSEEVSNK